MWSLCVVVFHILIDNISKMLLTKDEHLIDTLGFNAPDKPLNERIHIRAGNGGLDALYPPLL